MASKLATVDTTDEHTDFARLCRMIVDLCRDMLWELLISRIPAADLPQKVFRNIAKLKLSNDQYHKIYKLGGGVPTKTDVDISSLYTILRNICPKIKAPTNGWFDEKRGNFPGNNDFKTGDDIERIRLKRNKVYGHACEARISKKDFQTEIIEIRGIAIRMDSRLKKTFLKYMTRLETVCMDPESEKEYIDMILEQRTEDAETRKMVKDISETLEKTQEDLRQTKAGQKKSVATLESSIDENKTELKQLKGSVKDVIDNLGSMKQTVKYLDTEHKETKEAVETLELSVDENKKGLNQLKWSVRDATDNLENIEQIVKSLDTKHNETKDIVEDIKYSISDIEMTMRQKEAKLKKEQVDQKEFNREIDAAKILLEQHADLLKDNCLSPETGQTRIGLEKLKENNIIILTGVPGSGKTFLALNILLQVLDNDSSVNPLIISTPYEFKKVLDPSKQLVLFVDDMLGKFSVDNTELNQWNRYIDQLLAFINTRSLMVIITLRKTIMSKCDSEVINKIFQSEFIYDLDENQTIKEKEDMFKLFAKRNDISVDTELLQKVVSKQNCGIGFPFLCTVMKGQNILDLFSHPVEYLKNALLMMKKHDAISFVALLMTLFCENKLYRTSLNERQNRCMEAISNHFESSHIDKAKMLDAAETLVKTYLMFNEMDEYFSFVHDSVAESTFSAAKESILDILIRFCPLKTLTKSFIIKQTKSRKHDKKNETNTAGDLSCKKLVDRFKDEIRSDENRNAIQFIGSSFLWHDKAFCDTAIQELDPLDFYKEDFTGLSLLTYVSSIENSDLIETVLDLESVPVELKERQIYQSIKESCKFGKVKSFNILISITPTISDEIMFSAVQGGKRVILESLLDQGCNIETVKHGTNENLLHEACVNSEKIMVAAILSRCCEKQRVKLLKMQTTVEGNTPLLYAAKSGNVAIFRLLLENGSDVSDEDNDGLNSLHYAAMYGRVDLVKYISVHYKDLKGKVTKKGCTVAHSAAASNVECLDYLLQQGLSATETTVNGGTLLHEASVNGNVQVVKYICEKHETLLKVLDKDGETPCHYAARGGHVSCLAVLLPKEVDPYIKSNKGYTLMHEAAFWGKLDVLHYLCKPYSDMLTILDDSEASTVHHAAAGGHLDCLKYIIKNGVSHLLAKKGGYTLLHEASYGGKLDIVKYICKKYKGMIKTTDAFGGNAAYSAASGGHIDSFKYLVDQGIDTKQTKSNGETLLHTACFFGSVEIARHLCVSCNTIIEIIDDKKRTAAHSSAKGGHLACFKVLEEFDIDVLAKCDRGNTPLHTAAQFGQLNVVKYLCEHYSSLLLIENEDGNTPAYLAALGGHVDCVEALITFGTNPMLKYQDGKTILHVASKHGHRHLVNYICENYSRLRDKEDNDGQTAVYFAAQNGHLGCLKIICGSEPHLKLRFKDGKTLLHTSAQNGHFDVTKYLCRNDSSLINVVDNKGRTAAFYAAGGGHLECLKVIFEHGMDPRATTSGGLTILHAASLFGQLDVVNYICENYKYLVNRCDNDDRGEAYLAASKGHLECIQILIRYGVNPLSKCKDGKTLAHAAATYGHMNILGYCCQNYPSLINSMDNEGRTVAYCAAAKGELEIIKLCISAGNDPLLKNKSWETSLHAAAKFGHLNVVSYLCEHYPSILHIVDKYNQTAACVAAGRGELECLKYLLEQGIDPLSKCRSGQTLLHDASRFGHLYIVKYLCEFHRELLQTVDDKYGENAAHVAAREGHMECLQYLLQQTKELWTKSFSGRTFLHSAVSKGMMRVVEYLCEEYRHIDVLNIEDDKGLNASHVSAEKGHLECLKYLIQKNHDVLTITHKNRTLLHSAAAMGKSNVVAYLSQTYNNLLQKKDIHGQNPAHVASNGGHLECLKILIEQGVDPMDLTNRKYTVLHEASMKGRADIIQYLCQTQPNLMRRFINDAIKLARFNSYFDCLDILYKFASNLN